MLRSLYTAATGMMSNQLYVDSISNNLANANTIGFKKAKLEFQDLLYQTLAEPGATSQEGIRVPGSLQVGLGVKAQANTHEFTQGNLQVTGNAMDLAIQGDGFFQVERPDGSIGYTRDGTFKLDGNGRVVNSNGFPMLPAITVPTGSSEFTVTAEGRVSVIEEGKSSPTEIGQIEMARFVNPAGMRSIGQNLYTESEASGAPTTFMPGEQGGGTLAQKYVETSNVQLVEEMVNLIVAQRAYEISSKAITVSDEMLQNANNLKR